MLFRQVLSVTTTSERNSKVIITRTIRPKIASDCRTLFDFFFLFLIFSCSSSAAFAMKSHFEVANNLVTAKKDFDRVIDLVK